MKTETIAGNKIAKGTKVTLTPYVLKSGREYYGRVKLVFNEGMLKDLQIVGAFIECKGIWGVWGEVFIKNVGTKTVVAQISRIDYDGVVKIANLMATEAGLTESQRKAIKLAIEKNEKVSIKTYEVPCNDPNEECDIDTIEEYAMPNGIILKNKSHNY